MGEVAYIADMLDKHEVDLAMITAKALVGTK
jgi:hypothetical protein